MINPVLALDPGPVSSALLLWDGEKIRWMDIVNNEEFILSFRANFSKKASAFVIEQVCSYGMAVGASVFETVFWSGRFAQAWPMEAYRMPRMDVKMHLCHNSRAKDTNIRQALIDRLGECGTKKNPGPLYGVKKDLWAALALAVTWADLHNSRAEGGTDG